MSASLAKMLNAVLSHTDTLTSFTKTRMVTTAQLKKHSVAVTILDSLLLQARIFRNLRFSASSTVTLKPTLIHFVFGKLSLVTLQTVPKSSSTSSWHQERLSGMLKTVLFCFSLTVLMVKDRNIQVLVLKGSFNYRTHPTHQS